MPTGYLSASTLRQRTARHDRGPGRVQRVDRIAFDADLQSKVVHDNGVTDYHGVATRGGVAFEYEEPGGVVREFRPISQVMDPESLKGLHGAMFTLDHPGDGLDDDQGLGEVTPANARDLFHGVVLSVEPDIDSGLVKVWIRVFTQEGLAAIEGGKVELSCGYTTELVDWHDPAGAVLITAMGLGPELGTAANGERYDLVQTAIRYNHISAVDAGRAGPVASLKTDKAISMKTTTIKIDKRGSYAVPTWLLDAAAEGAKGHTDAGEVLAVEIEGRDPMTLPSEMVDTMLASIGIGAGEPTGPSMPEPEPPIVADAEPEMEPNEDALEEDPKMDAKTISKMIADGIAKAMPAAASKVTDAVATNLRDRADLERLAAPMLGPTFDYQAHTAHGLAVAVLDRAKSPKLTQAKALAVKAHGDKARGIPPDAKAAGKLEGMMETALEAHRDSQDSSGELGAAMFSAAAQDGESKPAARSTWRVKQDGLRASSTSKAKRDKAAA